MEVSLQPKKKTVSVTRDQCLSAIAKFIVYRRGLPATPYHVVQTSFSPPERFEIVRLPRPTTAAIAPASRAVPLGREEEVSVSRDEIMHALTLHLGLTSRSHRTPYQGNVVEGLPSGFPLSVRVVLGAGDLPHQSKPLK